ncbi:MAG: hypothetical protein ACC653_06270 [Gammaproteobacteria bacterium]
MVDKKNIWSDEQAALKKIQIHFEFQRDIMRVIRHEAADKDLNPSDIIRQRLDLEYSKIQRPRLGLSFNSDELNSLAKRYDLDTVDEKQIKRCVLEEMNNLYTELLDKNTK